MIKRKRIEKTEEGYLDLEIKTDQNKYCVVSL